MAILTITEQLEEVQTAISKTLQSQEYRDALGNGKELPLLRDLTAREKYLRSEYNRELNDNPVHVGSFSHNDYL